MWTLAFGQHEDRTLTHGYAAMTAFARAGLAGSPGKTQQSTPTGIHLGNSGLSLYFEQNAYSDQTKQGSFSERLAALGLCTRRNLAGYKNP